MNCPQCGNPVSPGDAFCDNCGANLSSAPAPPPQPAAGAYPPPQSGGATCPNCGASVIPGEAFCDNCGAALDQVPSQPAGKTGTQVIGESPPPPPPPSQGVYQAPPAGPAGAVTCPQCGTQLPAGSAFCDNCGASLGDAATPPPVQAPYPAPSTPSPSQAPYPTPSTPPPSQAPYPTPGTPPPPPGPYQAPDVAPGGVASPTPARLVVQKSNVTLPFPQGQTELIVGREDPVSGHFADIDLTDHGGDEGGVSRKHARFIFQNGQWYLEDMNSVNGTWINPRATREKLQSGQPQPLNNGDELRFGRVVLTFYTS